MFCIKCVFWFLFVCFVNCDEECITRNGKRGVCVKFNHCMAVVKDLQDGKQPQICSFEGRSPIVCCPDCEKINDTRHVVIDKSGYFYFKRGKKAYDKCLDYMVSLPYSCAPSNGLTRFWDKTSQCNRYRTVPMYGVSGVAARRAEYPHMALLGYGDDEIAAQWLCGGSVISEKYILTAGHCISSPILIQFSKHVLPACLNSGDAWDLNGFVTGWGAIGYRKEVADNLQVVFLVQFSQEQCAKQYPPARLLRSGYDHARQMCYGGIDTPTDTCEGDSGGPLQTTSMYSSCQHVILGVTSYGSACGIPGSSGMYTRVSHYLPWIESVVWP